MKKKTAENAFAPDSNDLNREGGINIPESEFPAPLIYKLSEFYRRWPDYPTGIVEIAICTYFAYRNGQVFTSTT